MVHKSSKRRYFHGMEEIGQGKNYVISDCISPLLTNLFQMDHTLEIRSKIQLHNWKTTRVILSSCALFLVLIITPVGLNYEKIMQNDYPLLSPPLLFFNSFLVVLLEKRER